MLFFIFFGILFVYRNVLQGMGKVIKQMEKDNLDAILISAPDAIFYITGYAVWT